MGIGIGNIGEESESIEILKTKDKGVLYMIVSEKDEFLTYEYIWPEFTHRGARPAESRTDTSHWFALSLIARERNGV